MISTVVKLLGFYLQMKQKLLKHNIKYFSVCLFLYEIN